MNGPQELSGVHRLMNQGHAMSNEIERDARVEAVPAGIKVMTAWRNRKNGREGLYEAGSMPSVDEAHPEYEFTRAFLIPATDAQWAMRHLDSLRDRVGGPALQSLDCVRSWLNAWRVAAPQESTHD